MFCFMSPRYAEGGVSENFSRDPHLQNGGATPGYCDALRPRRKLLVDQRALRPLPVQSRGAGVECTRQGHS